MSIPFSRIYEKAKKREERVSFHSARLDLDFELRNRTHIAANAKVLERVLQLHLLPIRPRHFPQATKDEWDIGELYLLKSCFGALTLPSHSATLETHSMHSLVARLRFAEVCGSAGTVSTI